MAIHNCSECDYCYSNETMQDFSICVNGNSEYWGEMVDKNGLACDDMECVVIDGKQRWKIDEDKELEELEEDEGL